MRERSALQAACGVVALAALGLFAAGGAASRPGGFWLGVPSVLAAAAVLAAVAAAFAATRRATGIAAGLLAVPVLLLAGAPLGALSGPPLLALALGAVVAALYLVGYRVPAALFLPVVLGLYFVMAARVQARVGPDGDEPHYLMVADSILRDFDLDLTRDYAEGRFSTFHPDPLDPHFRIRGRHGEIYSLHAIGLSLLVLPAYAVGGYPAASFFMALLAALLVREIRELVRSAWNDAALADGVSWVVALSPPVIHYAGLIFTEIPAALLVAFGLRRARGLDRLSPAGLLLWGTALGLLPWLNVRYALFPVVILGYALAQRPRWQAVVTALVPAAVSAVAIGAYHFILYGFFDPRGVYGRSPELAFGALVEGLPGLLFDQEFGLLVYAPVFALVVPGVFFLFRKSPRDAAVAAALVAIVLVTAGSWPMWRGGWNPPARFLVPVVPALALALAGAWSRGFSSPAALLVGWGLWAGLGGVAAPERVHRDRDGTASFFREGSGATEWTILLPGYVLGEDDRHSLAAVWGAALLAAVAFGGRRPSARGLVAATAGLALAAGAAGRISDARSQGRDAVRVLGRPALAVPGWRFAGHANAEWGPDALDWGALYEPHRHPDGATLADRLRVNGGRIEIDIDPALAVGEAPGLLVRAETQPPETARFGLRLEAGRLVGEFESPRPELALRLALEGGSPLILRSVRLSTFSPPAGPIP